MGSLWLRLLGLLSGLRIHMDLRISMGLAALPLRSLELLLFRMGLGSGRLWTSLGSSGRHSWIPGILPAGAAGLASAWTWNPDSVSSACNCESWTAGGRSMGSGSLPTRDRPPGDAECGRPLYCSGWTIHLCRARFRWQPGNNPGHAHAFGQRRSRRLPAWRNANQAAFPTTELEWATSSAEPAAGSIPHSTGPAASEFFRASGFPFDVCAAADA